MSELSKIETIIFQNKDISHSMTSFKLNKQQDALMISVTPDLESEYTKVIRRYEFKDIKNFALEVDEGEDVNDWPRPIIGIDFLDDPTKDFNVTINCAGIELRFFAIQLPYSCE